MSKVDLEKLICAFISSRLDYWSTQAYLTKLLGNCNCFKMQQPEHWWNMTPLDFSRTQRSSRMSLLTVPRVRTKHGEAAFSYYAAQKWNKLSGNIRHAPTLPMYRQPYGASDWLPQAVLRSLLTYRQRTMLTQFSPNSIPGSGDPLMEIKSAITKFLGGSHYCKFLVSWGMS